jgi:competence protein ComEC
VAIAVTAGILIDRAFSPSLLGSLFAAGILLAASVIAGLGPRSGLALVYLGLALTGFGAAYHHYRRDHHPADDIGWLARETPQLIQVQGFLEEEPRPVWFDPDDPLHSSRSFDAESTPTVAVLSVRKRFEDQRWLNASGRVALYVSGPLRDLHAGDEVEVVGHLLALRGPENPGERDYAAELRDAGVRATIQVRHTADVVTRLERGSWLAVPVRRACIRGWGDRTLVEGIPGGRGGLASALLLGEDSSLTPPEWQKYIHTGVIHVLVVSGQQLVVLAAFLWFCLRFTPLRQRPSVVIIVVILWLYAVLAGGRPSVVRAAATVSVFAGGVLLRRLTFPANALAAAWLLVLLLNPGDVANLGCLLSFSCVAVLYWSFDRQRAKEEKIDPLDQLVEASRPAWQRALLGVGRFLAASYFLSFLLWLVVTPLVVAKMHYLPLTGLLIGPPVVWLASVALVSGFLFLLASICVPFLAPIPAWATSLSLAGCEGLVDLGLHLSPRHLYLNDIPRWWLIGVYVLLSAAFFLSRTRRLLQPTLLVGLVWLGVGAAALFIRIPSDETRITFLAVGHGGCCVIETPDGRTLLYDTGSMRGPGVARQKIAPFLWHRGIRHIDEVFLSHADLDHFNGLRDLLDFCSVGQVTRTPSFALKENAAVRAVLDRLERDGIPVRLVQQGDRLRAGELTLDVLHPPETGPEGVENVRSLVLLVQHGRHRVLLTGDLEGVGLSALLQHPPHRVDVLMAPHHGSRRIDVRGLLNWSRPGLIVSQDDRREPAGGDPYQNASVRLLNTGEHGAVTLRVHSSGVIVETFVTSQRFVLRTSHRESD